MSNEQPAHVDSASPFGGGDKVLYSRSGADPVLIDHDARAELDDLDRTWGDDASNPRGNFVSAKRRRISQHWFVYVSARGRSLVTSRFFPIGGTALRISDLPVRYGTSGASPVLHGIYPPSPSLVRPENSHFSLIDRLDTSASPVPDAESPFTSSATDPRPMRAPVTRIPEPLPSIPRSAHVDLIHCDVGPQSPASGPIGRNMPLASPLLASPLLASPPLASPPAASPPAASPPAASPPTAVLGRFAVDLPWEQRLSDSVHILSVFLRSLTHRRIVLTVPTCVTALALSACLGALWGLRGQRESYHFYVFL